MIPTSDSLCSRVRTFKAAAWLGLFGISPADGRSTAGLNNTRVLILNGIMDLGIGVQLSLTA
jgi:hypothetical protein